MLIYTVVGFLSIPEFFKDRVLLCKSGLPRIHCVDQASFILTDTCLPKPLTSFELNFSLWIIYIHLVSPLLGHL